MVLRELTTHADDEALVEVVSEDIGHVDMYGNVVSSKYLTTDAAATARSSDSGELRLGIWDTDTFVGMISSRLGVSKKEAEIEYWLRASAIGRGYATLAVEAITKYLAPKYKRLFAEVHVEHQKSADVLVRVGYHLIGEVERDWGRALIFELRK